MVTHSEKAPQAPQPAPETSISALRASPPLENEGGLKRSSSPSSPSEPQRGRSTQLRNTVPDEMPTSSKRPTPSKRTALPNRSTSPRRLLSSKRSNPLQPPIPPQRSTSPKRPASPKSPAKAKRSAGSTPLQYATAKAEAITKLPSRMRSNAALHAALDLVSAHIGVEITRRRISSTESVFDIMHQLHPGKDLLTIITSDVYFKHIKLKGYGRPAYKLSQFVDSLRRFEIKLIGETTTAKQEESVHTTANELINHDGTVWTQLPTLDTRELISESMPFMELHASFRRMVYQDVLKAIKHEILQSLALNVEAECQATFEITWDIFSFLRHQIEGEAPIAQKAEELWSVVTLIGNTDRACATTCKEYMTWQWPGTAQAVIHAIDEIFKDSQLRDGKRLTKSVTVWSQRLPKKPNSGPAESALKRSIEIFPSRLRGPNAFPDIRVSGPPSFIIAVAQQLAWLIAVLRCPAEGKLSDSDIHFLQIGRSAFEMKALALRPVSEGRASCWTSLFPNSVLASDFPIPCRKYGVLGLELPFQMMLQLAGVLFDAKCDNGIYLRGSSTLLLPTNVTDEIVQWHLVVGDPKDPWPLDGRIHDLKWKLHKVDNTKCFFNKRTFLGVYQKGTVHLGTTECSIDEETPMHSGVAKEVRKNLWADSAQITGRLCRWLSIGATLKYNVTKGLSASGHQHSFQSMVDTADLMPIILFDTHDKDRRGWLVPALSVMLHMFHIWVRRYAPFLQNTLAYAEGGPKFDLEAKKAIRSMAISGWSTSGAGPSRQAAETPAETPKEIIESFYIQLLKLREQEYAPGDPRAGSGGLCGWEFMDVMARGDEHHRKHFKCDQNWLPLTEDTLVLFGQEFGDVIRPAPAICDRICENWNPIPRERNYLTAPVSLLKRLSTRMGCGERHGWMELKEGVYWIPQAASFQDCDHCREPGKRAICHKRPEQLTKKRPSRRQERYHPPEDGAVTFGGPDVPMRLKVKANQASTDNSAAGSRACQQENERKGLDRDGSQSKEVELTPMKQLVNHQRPQATAKGKRQENSPLSR